MEAEYEETSQETEVTMEKEVVEKRKWRWKKSLLKKLNLKRK